MYYIGTLHIDLFRVQLPILEKQTLDRQVGYGTLFSANCQVAHFSSQNRALLYCTHCKKWPFLVMHAPHLLFETF